MHLAQTIFMFFPLWVYSLPEVSQFQTKIRISEETVAWSLNMWDAGNIWARCYAWFSIRDAHPKKLGVSYVLGPTFACDCACVWLEKLYIFKHKNRGLKIEGEFFKNWDPPKSNFGTFWATIFSNEFPFLTIAGSWLGELDTK